jgi:hypothetical protein
MQRWEYMTYDLVKRANEIEQLNRLGREGWEAVSMVSSWGVGWRFVHPIVLLKRAVPDDAAARPSTEERLRSAAPATSQDGG